VPVKIKVAEVALAGLAGPEVMVVSGMVVVVAETNSALTAQGMPIIT